MQDEPSPVLLLATRTRKIAVFLLVRDYPLCPSRNFFFFFNIRNSLLTKFVRSRWMNIDLVLFCLNKQKINLSNMQPF